MTARLSLLLTGAALLACGVHRMHAQAKPAASGPGSFVSIGSGVSAYRNPYGQRTQEGREVFVDINPTWRYGFEAEGRWLSMNADEGVTLANYFAGLRVTALPGRISPYGKFLVGAGKINYPFNYATGTYFTYVPGGGVDLRVNDRLTIRAADFEYQLWQNFTFGPYRPYGVSVGVSFRLNGVSRTPKHAYYSRW